MVVDQLRRIKPIPFKVCTGFIYSDSDNASTTRTCRTYPATRDVAGYLYLAPVSQPKSITSSKR